MKEKETIIETLEKATNYLYDLDLTGLASIKQIANVIGYLGLSSSMKNYEFSVTFCPNKFRLNNTLRIVVFAKYEGFSKCIFVNEFKPGYDQFTLFGELVGTIKKSLQNNSMERPKEAKQQ